MQGVVKVSSKGQIVLPAKLREKAAIKKGAFLIVNLVGDKVVIEPLNKPKKDNWQQILQETAGIWPDIDPGYVNELRLAAKKDWRKTCEGHL